MVGAGGPSLRRESCHLYRFWEHISIPAGCVPITARRELVGGIGQDTPSVEEVETLVEIRYYVGFAVMRDEQRGWLSPFILNAVVLEALGDRIHLSPQLEGELREIRKELNICVRSWQGCFSFDPIHEFFLDVEEMNSHQYIPGHRGGKMGRLCNPMDPVYYYVAGGCLWEYDTYELLGVFRKICRQNQFRDTPEFDIVSVRSVFQIR